MKKCNKYQGTGSATLQPVRKIPADESGSLLPGGCRRRIKNRIISKLNEGK
jgi:hypothetical protein